MVHTFPFHCPESLICRHEGCNLAAIEHIPSLTEPSEETPRVAVRNLNQPVTCFLAHSIGSLTGNTLVGMEIRWPTMERKSPVCDYGCWQRPVGW